MPKYDKRAIKKSFWSSLARVVGVFLSIGAGIALRDIMGNDIHFLIWTAPIGFVIMWAAEYLSESA
jgi:hypothetical protein